MSADVLDELQGVLKGDPPTLVMDHTYALMARSR